jgi:hypothetical protein
MGRPRTDEEKRRVLLRTTATVVDHCVLQVECCVGEWPDLRGSLDLLTGVADAIREEAEKVGYMRRKVR